MRWNPLDWLTEKKRAYQLTFGAIPGNIVLRDLARFCRASETCFVPGNDRLSNVLEGRREVWLRIEKFRGLTPEELLTLLEQNIQEKRQIETNQGEDDA